MLLDAMGGHSIDGVRHTGNFYLQTISSSTLGHVTDEDDVILLVYFSFAGVEHHEGRLVCWK